MFSSFFKKLLPNFVKTNISKKKASRNIANESWVKKPASTPPTEEAVIVEAEAINYGLIQMPLPNFRTGWPKPADVAIIHYSAGYSVDGCYNALLSRKLSVHESVERNGKIYQHVSHSNRGIHAGYGQWAGRSNMNSRSLGVEVINFGWGYAGDGSPSEHGRFGPTDDELVQDPSGKWYRVESYMKNGEKVFTRVITRQTMDKFTDHREHHKNKLWSKFTPEQVAATHWLVWEWMKEHPNIILENVVGHEHVTPHRKTDPGPAWPWRQTESFLEAMAASERPELLDPSFKLEDRIKAVQSHVHRCGVNVGSIDGDWGPLTVNGISSLINSYNNIYKLELTLSDVRPESCLKLANAFRLIPGFDPGNR
jgi:N-acetyl-anhydromuramyl-L-alanine amidase AmpD